MWGGSDMHVFYVKEEVERRIVLTTATFPSRSGLGNSSGDWFSYSVPTCPLAGLGSHVPGLSTALRRKEELWSQRHNCSFSCWTLNSFSTSRMVHIMKMWAMVWVRASGQKPCLWRRPGRRQWQMGWSEHWGMRKGSESTQYFSAGFKAVLVSLKR